jgi:ATP-binding cassette subfamily C protein
MLASLDEQSKKDINEFIFSQKDLTMISVTHDLSKDNLKYYDNVILLRDGTVKRIFDRSEFDKIENLLI